MKKFTNEDYMYFSLLGVTVFGIILVCLYRFVFYDIVTFPTCPFYEYLGMYCPACGGTRSFLALLSGDILLSIYYQPVFLYAILIVGIYLLLQTIDRIRGKQTYTLPFSVGFVYVGIGLLLGNWILKNVWLLCFQMPM